jgi:tRNA(His) 5'-end guanylyltransferase
MNAAARAVMGEVQDITVAYGVSDEYRHVMTQGLSW